MYGVPPMNPNVVTIPIVQTGCCQSEFDPTYPAPLHGIIRPDEYQQSIENINQSFRSKTSLIICLVISILLIVGGFVLFIVGGVTSVTSRQFGFPVLIGVAIAIFAFGMIFCFCSMCIIQMNASSRLQKAVAEESAKYSNRSPTPCSWRLFSTRLYTGGYNNRNNRVMQNLIIEIGGHGAAGYGFGVPHGNQVGPLPPPYFAPPPPYGHGGNGFCPACGAARPDLSAHFCPSCGKAYAK